MNSEIKLWPPDFPAELQINPTRHPSVERAVKAVVTWNKAPTGALVLLGGTGVGKTTLAKIVLHAVGGPIPVLDWSNGRADSVLNAVLYDEPGLLRAIRESYRDGSEKDIILKCQRTRLLILDDIGAGHVKEESLGWYQDIFWRLLNARAGKTLITTNLTPSELRLRLGARAYSRLQQQVLDPEQFFVSLFNVPDFRAWRKKPRPEAEEQIGQAHLAIPGRAGTNRAAIGRAAAANAIKKPVGPAPAGRNGTSGKRDQQFTGPANQ